MARLFADENFPLPVTEELRRLGHDMLTLQEAGKGGQAIPDEAVIALTTEDERAVLTLNRKHFIQLSKTREHAGIIVCTFDPDFAGQAHRIDQAIQSTGRLDGRLLRVNRSQR